MSAWNGRTAWLVSYPRAASTATAPSSAGAPGCSIRSPALPTSAARPATASSRRSTFAAMTDRHTFPVQTNSTRYKSGSGSRLSTARPDSIR